MKKILIVMIILIFFVGINPPFVKANSADFWQLEIILPIDQSEVTLLGSVDVVKQNLQETIDNQLIDLNLNKTITVDDENFHITIQGNSLENFRQVAYVKLLPQYNLINHAVDINIEGEFFNETKILIESNPASGYFWNTDNAINNEEYEETNLSVGTSYSQIFYTENVNTINFQYRRYWEQENPTSIVNIKLNNNYNVIDLSSPIEKIEIIADEESLEVVSQGVVTPPYPDTLDWRNYIRMPEIRNQGGCGACWAFSTVGVMEIAIIMQGGYGQIDLSEQFLISCNDDNMDCNGGWYAHQYHKDKLGKNQNKIGAVLETSLPYSASNGICESNMNHPYKLQDYQYLPVSSNNIVDPIYIKDAIYKYGSVASGIVVDSDFGRYTGGIYTKDVQGTVNHGLVIIGWGNDPIEGDYWILRNSWGNAWGENGYMRIKIGVSKVGHRASYVIYNSDVIGEDWIEHQNEVLPSPQEDAENFPVIETPEPSVPVEKQVIVVCR